jgi:hypothetical protein
VVEPREESLREPTATAAVRQRVVLLGASNLTRGLSTVVHTARNLLGERLEIVAALGHGRSYGMTSTYLGREMPGILESGIWEALAELPPAPTVALVTDIGNDLVYDVEVPQVAAWIEAAIDRLERAQARVVMTLLPVETIKTLSEWRFRIFRTLLFPRCSLSLQTLATRAYELNDRVRELGQRRGVRLVEQRAWWYGLDPIHPRIRHWPTVWHEYLSPWREGECPRCARASSPARWVYLRLRKPHRYRQFGVARGHAQPCGSLRDGTTIALY